MKSIILFDIDGTIADNTHRQHFLLPPVVSEKDRLVEKNVVGGVCYYCLQFTETPHQTGCYAIAGWRKNWEGFFAAQSKDPVNYDLQQLWLLISIGIGNLVHTKSKLALITGRPEKYRAETEEWLERHHFRYYERLVMRPDDDQTDDHILKIKQAESIWGLDKILCVFEDRSRIVRAWREAGVSCCQVADGDF